MQSSEEDTAFSTRRKTQMVQVHHAGETTCDWGPQQVREQRGGLSQVGHHSEQGKPLDDGQQTSDDDGSRGITDET